MIEYLKIEITSTCFAHIQCRELRFQIQSSRKRYEKRQICSPDDLVSFFDQIFDSAKEEIKQLILEEKVNEKHN